MKNHQMLQVNKRPTWETIKGGSHVFVKTLQKHLSGNLLTNIPVQTVQRFIDKIKVITHNSNLEFDRVLFACHNDQTLYYYKSNKNLNIDEKSMLSLYTERGQFNDDQDIFELGCGWGSLTLYLAEKYPNSNITGLSNSNSQRIYILEQAKLKGLTNIQIIICDINQFDIKQRFDRIISIEILEQVSNYQQLSTKYLIGLMKMVYYLFMFFVTVL